MARRLWITWPATAGAVAALPVASQNTHPTPAAHFQDYVIVGEVDGCLIEWKGEQLNQDDHDTFLQLIKMARHKAFGDDVVQQVNAILRGLNRHTQKEQRRQFFEQADRLMSGTIRITPRGKPSYAGHLLADIVTPHDQRTEPQYKRHLLADM